jgi:hypothetical protein
LKVDEMIMYNGYNFVGCLLSERNQQRAKDAAMIGRFIGWLAFAGILIAHIVFWWAMVWTMSYRNIGGAVGLMVPTAIPLIGLILSHWFLRTAGVIIVLYAIAFGIFVGVSFGPDSILIVFVLGLLILCSGVLFLYSWWLSRKAD